MLQERYLLPGMLQPRSMHLHVRHAEFVLAPTFAFAHRHNIPAIDIAVLLTPPATHAKIAAAAIRVGLPGLGQRQLSLARPRTLASPPGAVPFGGRRPSDRHAWYAPGPVQG